MKDLSKKIKEFEKIVRVPYLKRTPKYEPKFSYFHLVECLGKCMMRCGENNHHVHDGSCTMELFNSSSSVSLTSDDGVISFS